MRVTKFIPVLAVPALLMSCDRQPVAPDMEVEPLFKATHEVVTTNLDEDATWYVECANGGAGEDVRFTGPYTITDYYTTSANGNVNLRWRISFDPGFNGVGQESGHVWMIDVTSSSWAGHQNFHGDGLSWQNTGNEFYINQHGDRLHVAVNFHQTRDANGNITAARFYGNCPGGK